MLTDEKFKYLKYTYEQFITFAKLEIYHFDLLNRFVSLRKPKLYCFKCVAEEQLGIQPSKFKELLRKLRNYNLRFSALIDTNLIGLRKVVIFVPGKEINDVSKVPLRPWLRGLTRSISPRGTFLTYYYPWNADLNTLLSAFDENVEFFVSFKSVAQTPRFNLFFDWKIPGIKPLNRVADRLLVDIKKSYDLSKSPIDSLLSFRPQVSTPKDWLDLLIMKELEKNAFIGIDGLSKILGYRKASVRKHFVNHVNNAVVTIRPKFAFMDPEASALVLDLIYSRDIKLIRAFLDVMIKTPYLVMALICNDALIAQMNIYYRDLPFLSEFLTNIGFNDFDIHVCTYVGAKSFTLPWSNFDLWNGSWALIRTEVIERKLEERFRRRTGKAFEE